MHWQGKGEKSQNTKTKGRGLIYIQKTRNNQNVRKIKKDVKKEKVSH